MAQASNSSVTSRKQLVMAFLLIPALPALAGAMGIGLAEGAVIGAGVAVAHAATASSKKKKGEEDEEGFPGSPEDVQEVFDGVQEMAEDLDLEAEDLADMGMDLF